MKIALPPAAAEAITPGSASLSVATESSAALAAGGRVKGYPTWFPRFPLASGNHALLSGRATAGYRNGAGDGK